MSLADQQWCPTSVQVTVLQARGLRIKGKSGTNDAYAVMQVGKEKFQTSVVEKSVAPVWKEEAAFDLPPLHQGAHGSERGTLHVHVLHRALVGPDKLLGQAVINLLQLSEDKTRSKTEWFKLLDKSGKPDKDRGEVLLDIQFMRNNMTASMFDLSAAGKSRSRLGKFKDKVRGKKKESDSGSSTLPSFTQVLTDSEEEANGDEVAASKDGKNKKHKMKSLFSPKSNLQKNMSQSMSVLPAKNSTLSGSQSSGLNVDSSEGKKKFKFKIHKRSGSSDSKDSSSGHQKQLPVEQSNLCINGSHIYCEEPPTRTSRIGSNFSLASSGHGSMEEVPENSPPSVDSLRAVRQYSPWREEEEEEEAVVENAKEDESRQEEEERLRMKEEEEEKVRRHQEELERLAEEEERRRAEEEKVKREEEERIRREEEERVRREEEECERLAEEQRRLEEQERRKMEEERIRIEEEERRRRIEEEEERVRREEEDRKLAEERRRMEEEERRMEEEERRRKEEARAEEERRQREEEEMRRQEAEERVRKEREEYERLMEEKRKLEEEEKERIEAEEKLRKEKEEERKRMEEEKRREELERKQREEEEKRRQEQQDRKQREEEEMRRHEEDERARREYERLMDERRKLEEEKERIEAEEKIRKEEERIRMEEEQRRKEEMERKQREEEEMRRQEEEERARREYERLMEKEKERIEAEEKLRKEEEERIRMEEEQRRKEEIVRKQREEEEMRRREEEERVKKEKKEYERLMEEKRKLEEEKKRIEAEEKLRKEEEERIKVEEERRKQEEEEKRRQEEQERIRAEEEKRKREEEERARKEKEEYERLEEERMKQEEERRRIEEEERIRKEEKERIRMKEEKRKQEEERARKEMERLAEERRRLEEEERRIEEEEKVRKEEEERVKRKESAEKERKEKEEARRLEKEKLRRDEQKKKENKDGLKAAGKKSKVSSSAEVSTNPFDENYSYNPFEEIPDSPPGAKEAAVQQRSASSSVGSKIVSTDEKELIGAQREKRLAPQPPGRNQAEKPFEREQDASAKHLAQINAQNKDKDVKTVSVPPQRSVQMITPVSRSTTDAKDAQSSTQSSTAKGATVAGKHNKRPAPLRPRSVEEEPKTTSTAETKQTVYGLNPFENDEDENELTAASQTKIKSSKVARAPPPPKNDGTVINQNTEGGRVTEDAVPDTANKACDPQREAINPVQVQESPVKEPQPVKVQNTVEAGVKKEAPPTAARRLQPVKPLHSVEQQSVSAVQGENKSTGIHSEDKTKVNDTGLKGPYSQLTQEELISLVLKQESQLSDRNKKISELEQYIDNLLVRVIEEQPSILMSINTLKKAA